MYDNLTKSLKKILWELDEKEKLTIKELDVAECAIHALSHLYEVIEAETKAEKK